MKRKLKSLPPGADAGVPFPTKQQKDGIQKIRVNPAKKRPAKGWVA